MIVRHLHVVSLVQSLIDTPSMLQSWNLRNGTQTIQVLRKFTIVTVTIVNIK